MIRRLRALFAQPAFAVLLAAFGVAVFGWPFPELARTGGDFAFFIYFFCTWVGAILISFLLSRVVQEQSPEDGDHV